ncbi:MAG: glycosyltransferase [Thermoplasmata archaeon]
MKVLLIPSGDWFSQIPTRHKFMTRILASRGHEVHVLRIPTSQENSLSHHRTYGGRVHELRASPLSDTVGGNEIFHYGTRTAAYGRFIRKILVKDSIDVVLSANLLPSAVCAIVARMAGTPIVYDVIDYYPDFVLRYHSEGMGLKILRSIADRVFRFNLKHADRLIMAGRAIGDFLRDRYPELISSKPMIVIGNGISRDMVGDGIPSTWSPNCEVASRGLRVGLVGNLEFWIDHDFIVDFYRTLKGLDPSSSMRVFGSAERLAGMKVLQKLKSELSQVSASDGYSYEGFVPHSEIRQTLASIDIGLIPFRTDLRIAEYASPIKLLEYLAAGVVAVATPIKEVQSGFGGVTIVDSSGSRAARRAFALFQDSVSLAKQVTQGQALAASYTWESLATSLEDELRKAVPVSS